MYISPVFSCLVTFGVFNLCIILLLVRSHGSDVAKKVQEKYVELKNLSISSILDKLFANNVITLEEMTRIRALTLETEKMGDFLDKIILPSLANNVLVKFEGFLRAMRESEDLTLNDMARKLGA